jgi:hypothetical protein
MANHNQGHHCCSQTQPTKESHIETKIEGLLDKFKTWAWNKGYKIRAQDGNDGT